MYNEADAPFGELAEFDALDWRMRDDVFIGNACFTGCVVSAQGTPDGTVSVSAGTARINTSDVTCAGGTVSVLTGSANPDGSTASAPHATLQRYDLIVLNSAGTLGVIHGAVTVPTFQNHQVVKPKYPAWSGSQIVLAVIYVLPSSEANAGKISIGAPGSDHSELVRKTQLMSKSMLYDDPHLISGNHHTGTITDTQHGIRTLASAHALSDLSGTLSIAQGLGKPQALTGATATALFAGGVASGAPASGTHVVGEFAVDQTGKMWICTGAGTPGTWGLVGGTGLATDPLADAKGDTFVATAADTIVRVPVGTDGQVRVADSSATSGMRWESKKIAAIVANTAAISTTETAVASGTIPANTLAVGDTFKIRCRADGTTGVTPGTATPRIRFGPTTLTGAVLAGTAGTLVASRTNQAMWLEGEVVVRTIGPTGTLTGVYIVHSRPSTSDIFAATGNPFTGGILDVVVDTTIDNLLQLTLVTTQAGSSFIVYLASIVKL
jgi:hypothetical protein